MLGKESILFYIGNMVDEEVVFCICVYVWGWGRVRRWVCCNLEGGVEDGGNVLRKDVKVC